MPVNYLLAFIDSLPINQKLDFLCSVWAIQNQCYYPRIYSDDQMNDSQLHDILRPVIFFQELDNMIQNKFNSQVNSLEPDTLQLIMQNIANHPGQIIIDCLRLTPFLADQLISHTNDEQIKTYHLLSRHNDSENYKLVYSRFIARDKFEHSEILKQVIEHKLNQIWQDKWSDINEISLHDSLLIKQIQTW